MDSPGALMGGRKPVICILPSLQNGHNKMLNPVSRNNRSQEVSFVIVFSSGVGFSEYSDQIAPPFRSKWRHLN